MAQIDLDITVDLQQDLDRLMRARGFRHMTDAIRVAVHEAAERLAQQPAPALARNDFQAWIGIGRGPEENPAPRFKDDDDLWENG